MIRNNVLGSLLVLSVLAGCGGDTGLETKAKMGGAASASASAQAEASATAYASASASASASAPKE